MEFEIGSGTLMLPDFHIAVMGVAIIYLLVKWSKEMETGRIKVFLYFLASSYVLPILSYRTEESGFEFWFPAGFVLIFFYLRGRPNDHAVKRKASLLGFGVALYQMAVYML